jgi:hypothetical protein
MPNQASERLSQNAERIVKIWSERGGAGFQGARFRRLAGDRVHPSRDDIEHGLCQRPQEQLLGVLVPITHVVQSVRKSFARIPA